MKLKLTIGVIVVMLAGAALLHAVEVIFTTTPPTGCEKIGDIRVGDLFNRYPKDIVVDSLRQEALKLKGDKISIELVTHVHPKLGVDYTGTALVWKCSK